MDRVFAVASLGRNLRWRDQTRWAECRGGFSWFRSAGAQLWLSASQLLEMDPRLFFSSRAACEYARSAHLRDGQEYLFREFSEAGDRESMQWNFRCGARNGLAIESAIDGRGPSLHRLPYIKTDCSGSFEVVNNSLASASLLIRGAGGAVERLETKTGAVLEMVG